MMEFLRDLGRRHNELKKRIHNFRYPLGPKGKFVMGFIYFATPIVIGYAIMKQTMKISQANYETRDPSYKVLEYPDEDTVKVNQGARMLKTKYEQRLHKELHVLQDKASEKVHTRDRGEER